VRRRGRAVRQRATYHHGDLRAALISAASALLEREGPLGVTLRGAARHAGVSQAAPYRHFPSKSALLAAVAEAGFRSLARAMSRAAQRHRTEPVRALEAIAAAVVRFAAEHPSRYRLMSGPAVRGRDHPSLRAAATASWELVTAAIRECQRAGRMRAGDAERLGFVFWALIHGLAVLVVDEQLPSSVVKVHRIEQLAGYATDVLLAGLGPQGG
jgi:AcrR family transcriptional regulator